MSVHPVHNGFTIEIYSFKHLHTLLACATHGGIATEDSEDRRQWRIENGPEI